MKQNAKKNLPLVKQNVMKLEVFILGRQRIDQKRKKGWGRGRRERIEKGSREMIEISLAGQTLNNARAPRRERESGDSATFRGSCRNVGGTNQMAAVT